MQIQVQTEMATCPVAMVLVSDTKRSGFGSRRCSNFVSSFFGNFFHLVVIKFLYNFKDKFQTNFCIGSNSLKQFKRLLFQKRINNLRKFKFKEKWRIVQSLKFSFLERNVPGSIPDAAAIFFCLL